MKRKHRILPLGVLLGGLVLGLIGLGPMACSEIHRDVEAAKGAVQTEKAPGETPNSAASVRAATEIKPHHQAAALSCEDCHGSGKLGAVRTDICLSCHGTSEEVASSTSALKLNPHDSLHYGPDLDCDLCHHEHATSENYCNICHEFDMKVP